MSELKRCPICGGEAEIERIGTMKQSMIIVCTNCGCRVESGDVQGLTKPESYKWNMRVRDADNERLREALERVQECLPSNPDMGKEGMLICVRRIAGITRTALERDQ